MSMNKKMLIMTAVNILLYVIYYLTGAGLPLVVLAAVAGVVAAWICRESKSDRAKRLCKEVVEAAVDVLADDREKALELMAEVNRQGYELADLGIRKEYFSSAQQLMWDVKAEIACRKVTGTGAAS